MFLLQAKWTPRCPDWKEVQISLQRLHACSLFISQDERTFSLSSFTFIKNSYWHRINTQSMIAFVMYLVLMGTNFNFLCSDVLDSLVNFEDIKNGCVLITM